MSPALVLARISLAACAARRQALEGMPPAATPAAMLQPPSCARCHTGAVCRRNAPITLCLAMQATRARARHLLPRGPRQLRSPRRNGHWRARAFSPCQPTGAAHGRSFNGAQSRDVKGCQSKLKGLFRSQGCLITISICRAAWRQVRLRGGGGGAAAAPHARSSEEYREDVVVASIDAAAGLVLYTAGRRAWSRGPLRGSLSVFGASPELDVLASRERYLAEKLAEFSGSATGGVASLIHLSSLDVRDSGGVREPVSAMIRYAQRSAGVQNLLVRIALATSLRRSQRLADCLWRPRHAMQT